MRLVALTCEVLARSVYLCAARSSNVVDVQLNRRGLHDQPPNLRTLLQRQVDDVGPPHEAVVLAYGLCGGAIAGIHAGNVPLVVPRAHDCITLFLGGRERYQDEFSRHPGTFWFIQDYLERGDDRGAFAGMGAISDTAARAVYEDYVERYGVDNAQFLMEALAGWTSHYDRAGFIDMGIAEQSTTKERARSEAERHAWDFDKLAGELMLIRRLIDGDWSEDFLVLQPGEQIAMAYDVGVITAVSSA